MLLAEPTSVSTKPSGSHAEASWSVLVFIVTVIKGINKQTLNHLIEHLEEEELVKHHNSIRLTVSTHLSSMRQALTHKFDLD